MKLIHKLDRQAEKFDEDRDCAVKAIAVVTGCSYKKAHEIAANFSRQPRDGLLPIYTWQALASMGFFLDVLPIPAKTVVTLERWLDHQDSRNFYLIHMHNHVAGARGSRLHDWTRGRKFRIRDVLQVIPRTKKARNMHRKVHETV